MQTNSIKWPEIFSLGFLSVSIAISWVAYHEYQPHLLEAFDLQNLASLLIYAKAVVLIVVPPLAGLVADYFMRKRHNYFLIFSIGISVTAMIFMVVASIIGAGPLGALSHILPLMVILWLISMNIFVSPAFSMIDAFAPVDRLPVVVGFLVFVTELVYALEPVVVQLVNFFGATMTFIVGGILIASSGLIFYRVSSKNVIQHRRSESLQSDSKYLPIIVIALILGLAKAIIIEFLPERAFFGTWSGQQVSLAMLALSAVITFILSQSIKKYNYTKLILFATGLTVIGCILLLGISYAPSVVLIAIGLSLFNLVGLPFAITNLSARGLTAGVGIFIGVSEIFTGILEIMFQ